MGRRALRPIDPSLDLSRHFFVDEDLPRPWSTSALFPVVCPGEESADAAHTSDEERAHVAARPLELDIGCGKGMYISAAAAATPERNFIGVELRGKYARYTASRLARRRLTNAISVKADAERLLREDLPPDSIAAIHVYFPDPWWKARHKKRRIMNADFLKQVERVLQPGGKLHFWTDVEEYFLIGVETVKSATKLEGPFDVPEKRPEHDLDYRTNFERRKRMLGLSIFRAEFVKQPGN